MIEENPRKAKKNKKEEEFEEFEDEIVQDTEMRKEVEAYVDKEVLKEMDLAERDQLGDIMALMKNLDLNAEPNTFSAEVDGLEDLIKKM